MGTQEPLRHTDRGLHLVSFADRILVVCPKCGGRAINTLRPGIERPEYINYYYSQPRRVTCRCGYARDFENLWCVATGPCCSRSQTLWLQTTFDGHTLWAYNEDHIDELAAYVAATLRENPNRYRRSMAVSLPGWMKRAEHRTEILRALTRLRSLAA